MNVLRLTDGVASELFTQRTGLPLSQLAQRAAKPSNAACCSSDPRA